MGRRREIILARIFFSDSPESKVRPCIILSNDQYHTDGFLLVASITTSKDEYCIPISENDANCFLETNSSARFDGITKLATKHVIKNIGKITPEFYSKLVEKIIGMLK
jgi:mRNA-degrading endonuclease toxin of MazEF toxin-antitoxin module